MNAIGKLLKKDPNNMLSSQNISQHISKAFIDPKHTHTRTHTHMRTHTQNKSNQFYISKTSLENLVSIYTYVFLVIAKSHCTWTCIKSSKEFVCYV